ncbi:MAG: HAMP domain-containing histidine kinase [Oscillospiraceae bacterium]|nr:HAMP domain-containing histidine kinase [Oscillospiraceae bacterium]
MRLSFMTFMAALMVCALCAVFLMCVFQSDFLSYDAQETLSDAAIVIEMLKTETGKSAVVYYTDEEDRQAAFEATLPNMIPEYFSDSIAIYKDGKPVYSRLPDGVSPEPLFPDKEALWQIETFGTRRVLCLYHPVMLGDRLYTLVAVRDESEAFSARDRQLRTSVLILCLFLVLAGGVFYLISRRSMHRMALLSHTAKRLAGGDLSVRADERGNDELAALSANLNRMTARISEQMDELRSEAERKELFVGAFSHELKTPMTSIIGYADLLLRKELTQEQRHMCLSYIFTEGKRLESMSMRLLDLIVMGKQEIYKKPVSVQMLIRDVVTLIMPQITKADIRLIYNVAPGEIEMEEELMKTVFINLLDNACNALETGGQIRIDGRWQAGTYLLSVRDNGKGMEEAVLSRITDAFYMADKSRSRRHGGAGLGLAICSEILSLHDFSIRFESKPGKGTLAEVSMKGGKA